MGENRWEEKDRREDRMDEEEDSFYRNCKFPKTILKSPAINNITLILFVHRQGMTFTASYHTL
jgi:hypothetical protein